MRITMPRTKWCHVTLSALNGRRLFKIARTARFCERVIRVACRSRGWAVDTVSVRPERVQVLIRVPRKIRRRDVVQVVRDATVAALRRRSEIPGMGRIFRKRWWCGVLTRPAAVSSLRRRLRSVA